jgi:hypothetical protein
VVDLITYLQARTRTAVVPVHGSVKGFGWFQMALQFQLLCARRW